jgi:hypothetical protein
LAFGDDSKPAQHHISFRYQDTREKKISGSTHTKEISDKKKFSIVRVLAIIGGPGT